ncbi:MULTISPECIES: hypothetical protein [Erwiniaceae]|uniref:hypothetical protein n=1 Tax=Erwiniaceae TaxID=1903409 RepID=UPI000C182A4E|nr:MULTISPECIES: hypothetical protein [Erwiniaceae]PIJ43321.1 hypothetical protein BOM24_09135 [Tatumella sp. OPLPL6]
MEYTVYLEYSNGRQRSNVRRCTSKAELKQIVKELFKDKELLSLAEKITVKTGRNVVYSGDSSLSHNRTWKKIDQCTNDAGQPRKIREGVSTSLYVPAGLIPVLRARGNGSISSGLISVLKQCKDKEVVKEVTL